MEFFFQDAASSAPVVRRNPLFTAASRGDVAAFSRALAEEGDAEGQYSVFEAMNGLNAVHIASRKNNVAIMELVLEKYDSHALDTCTEDGRSPLMVAAAEDAVEVMRLLCGHAKKGDKDVGGYVMKVDAVGNTAIHHAAWRGNLRACRMLVEEEGADPFARNNDGMTPQQFAAAGNHTDVIEYLLQLQETSHHDADVSNTGINDLHRACMHGAIETVALLLSRHKANASARTANGNNALHVAAQNGYVEIVKYLVEDAGVDMNTQNKFGLSPLHLACSSAHLEVVKNLLSRGADVSLRSVSGSTALHFAAASGNHEICRMLTTAALTCAELTAEDDDGHTPIDMALSCSFRELASKLARWSYVDARAQVLVRSLEGLASI